MSCIYGFLFFSFTSWRFKYVTPLINRGCRSQYIGLFSAILAVTRSHHEKFCSKYYRSTRTNRYTDLPTLPIRDDQSWHTIISWRVWTLCTFLPFCQNPSPRNHKLRLNTTARALAGTIVRPFLFFHHCCGREGLLGWDGCYLFLSACPLAPRVCEERDKAMGQYTCYWNSKKNSHFKTSVSIP